MLFKNKHKELPPLTFCEAGADGLREWLSLLPRQSLHALTNRLITAGSELNAANCDETQMDTALSILEPTITEIAQNLYLQATKSGDTPNDASRDLQKFCTVFGRLYFFAGQQSCTRKPSLAGENKLSKSAELLARSIVVSYQLYETAPPLCWQQLHAIYQYSITDCRHEEIALSINNTYKVVVTLACASPEEMQSNQIKAIADYLRTATATIKLQAQTNEHSYFQICLDSDEPPHRRLSSANQSDNDLGDIDTQRPTIYPVFKELIELLRNQSLNRTLTDHLILCLDSQRHRVFNRLNASGEIAICRGMSAIHYYMADKTNFTQFVQTHFRANAKPLKRASDESKSEAKKRDVWDGIYSSSWQELKDTVESIELSLQGDPVPSFLSHDDESHRNIQSPAVVNANAKGYCLKGKSHTLRDFDPDSLVALRSQDDDHWQIAAIRWTKTTDNWRKMGIELLSPQCIPCAIKLDDGGPDNKFAPALLISRNNAKYDSIDAIEQFYLVTTKRAIASNTRAILVVAHGQRPIIFTACVEHGPSYCYFSIENDPHIALNDEVNHR